MSLNAGLTYPKKLAGIGALSCYLLLKDTYPGCISDAQKDTPVRMYHGKADAVVSHKWGEQSMQALKGHGVNIEFASYSRLGHGSNPQEMREFLAFINEVLPEKVNEEL